MSLASATREVTSKSEAALERETAKKWAERARACYRKHRETGDVRWLLRAEGYCHEALEHGALAGMDLDALKQKMHGREKRGRRG